MNIEAALLLTDSSEIYRALMEAESRFVEHCVIVKLRQNYEKALNREYIAKLRSSSSRV